MASFNAGPRGPAFQALWACIKLACVLHLGRDEHEIQSGCLRLMSTGLKLI